MIQVIEIRFTTIASVNRFSGSLLRIESGREPW
jgi:hypothetical protein